jgi:PKD repeat protein
MKQTLGKVAAGSFLLTALLGATLATAGGPRDDGRRHEREDRGDPERREGREARAGEAREKDDPGARARAMYEWYNDTRGQPQRKRAGDSGLWSPEYQRFMMQAAKRERLRYAGKMPPATSQAVIDPSWPVGGTKAAGDSPSRDLKWVNIGPTKANFATNGGTLNVTDSGRVNAIVTDPASPNTIYVAFSGGGLWKSTDGGAFWQAKTETLGSLSIGTVAMDPNNSSILYLGLGDRFDGTGVGIVKMTDGGDTWTDPVFLGDSTSISNILVMPNNSSVVLVATDKGLYRSTDAGRTYAAVAVDTGVAETPKIWALAYGGGNTAVMSLEAAPSANNDTPTSRQGQIWRTADGGATWARATGVTHTAGLNRISLASAPSNRSVMYALAMKSTTSTTRANDTGNIFKSTDGGATWTGVATTSTGAYKSYSNTNAESSSLQTLLGGQGFYNHAVVVDPTNANIAYFGGQLLLAKTTDGGSTFRQMTNWLAQYSLAYVHADFHAAHIASNGTLYAGTDGGIFRSTDGGTTFTHTLNEGIASHLVYNVCSTPANADRVLIGLQDNGTRLRETNTSVFNQVVGGDGFGCNVNTANANTMLGSLYYLRFQKSTNGGSSFSQACSGITECNDPNNAPFNSKLAPWAGDATGNTLFTYSNTKVYRTTNYAGTWAAIGTTGFPADIYIRGVNVAKNNGTATNSDTVVGVVASAGRVFLTTNRGTGWTQAGALPNHGSSLSSIAFDPTNRNIVYVTSVAADATKSHVWRSTDFGATWAAIDGNGFPTGIPVNSIAIDPVLPTSLYAATHLGVYRSTDSGSTWERFGAWLPLVNVTEVAVSANGNQVRAATFGRSVWELANVGNNVAPVANFTVSTSNLTATFTDTSTDSDGTIQRRQWNFGDGVSSSMTNPAHTYAAAGTYTVTLTVTDNGGYSHTRTASVTVTAGQNAPPVANFTSTTSGLSATFTDSSTDSDGTIASRSWNFGDSTSSTVTNPSHTYAAAGTYTVTLTVTDNAGATNSVSKSVTVTAPANNPPTANFTFTTSGLSATFTDGSSDSDGTIASRSWNFGDSTTSTATNPSKTYAAAGTYTVTLTVTDNGGATNTVSKSVTVTAPPSNTLTNGVPVTGITLASKATQTWTMTVPAGATNLKFVTSGGTGDADLYVKFGSAPTTTTNDCKSEGGTSAETCNIATAQAGTYYVMVLAYNAISGVSLTGSYTDPASNTPPTANFTFATSGLTATFTDGSTDSNGSIASRSWNFGDGTTSTVTNPSKTYTAAGTYTVTLTVTDNGGATNSVSKSVTVTTPTTTQLLLNPGFESGATSWTASTGVITSGTSKTPRTGTWYAWMGGKGVTTTQTMTQSVAIPSGRTSATLAFFLKIDTAETTTSTQYDKLTVQVLNSAGTVLKTCATYSNLNKGTSYVERTCDLTAYIGQTVTVKFNMTEDSSLQTSFVIDDTALNVQ